MKMTTRIRARLARASRVANGLVVALVLAALVLGACGVKAPPRPPRQEPPAKPAAAAPAPTPAAAK
jgi:hypothetical protein